MILNDFVEPYRLGIFKEMTVGQKNGFMKILVLDAVGIGAVLYWIVGMGNAENVNNSIFPLLHHAQWKRKFRPEFEGTDEEREGEDGSPEETGSLEMAEEDRGDE